MNRIALCCAVTVLATSCIFSRDGEDLVPDAADMAAADTANGNGDSGRDTGSTRDASPPDMQSSPDMMPADMSQPDMSQPDMTPPNRDPSAVCQMGVVSDVSGGHEFRLRVNSDETLVSAGFVVPGEGADVLGQYWSQWDTSELWVDMPFRGVMSLETEALVPDPTGIAPVPWFGFPGAIITRRDSQKCIFAEWNDGQAGSLDCTDAWGAEIANLGGPSPVYFWFGGDGTLSSMPVDDFAIDGQRITVPWCAQDPMNPTECLPLEYGTTEARANRGPNVLLSDSLGRAYLWDAVQNIDGSQGTEDCVMPPTAPVPLMIQGMPVMFANADIVRVGGQDVLVHQTAASVELRPLDANHQPMAATDQLDNTGLRPHFDAASDGTRVAAVAAVGSDARVFAFGMGGGTRDVVIEDAAFNTTAAGVAVNGDQVAVVAGKSGFFVVVANAFVMWQ